MTKERISYIDLGAGIMILWMILCHANMAAGWTDIALRIHYPNFLFFFMPWFFYKSGQFFRKRDKKDELKKDWEKLMHQFLFWSVLGYVVYLITLVPNGFTFRNVIYVVIRRFIFGGSIELNHPLWFLYTLFLVKQAANILLPTDDDKYYWIKCGAIIFTGYLIAFAAYCINWRFLPIWIANGSSGLAYFTLGYCMQKNETKWWLFIPCILGYLACCIWGFPGIDMHQNKCRSASIYLIGLPASFAGIVTFNVICRLVVKYLHYISMPIEYVGKYAMIIYASHGLLYNAVPYLLDELSLEILYPYMLWIILASYAIFLPLFCVLSNRINRKKQTDIKTTSL